MYDSDYSETTNGQYIISENTVKLIFDDPDQKSITFTISGDQLIPIDSGRTYTKKK